MLSGEQDDAAGGEERREGEGGELAEHADEVQEDRQDGERGGLHTSATTPGRRSRLDGERPAHDGHGLAAEHDPVAGHSHQDDSAA